MRRLAVTTVLLVFMGCGTDTTAKGIQPIDNRAVDAAFLETPTTTTTVAPPRPPSTLPPTTLAPTTLAPTTVPSEDVFLYFITPDSKLKQVRKRRPVPIVPLEVIGDLFKPTDPTLKSFVTNGMVQSVTVGKVTTVVLNPSYSAVGDADKPLLIGQITLTLTWLRSISQVQYTIDGQVVEVPTAAGPMSVVGQVDYADGVAK
jgi:Sporulation and spore germination